VKKITEVPLVQSDIYEDNAERKGGPRTEAKDGVMEESLRVEQPLVPIIALHQLMSRRLARQILYIYTHGP